MKIFTDNVVAEAVDRADIRKRKHNRLFFEMNVIGSFFNLGGQCLIYSLLHLSGCGTGKCNDQQPVCGAGFILVLQPFDNTLNKHGGFARTCRGGNKY